MWTLFVSCALAGSSWILSNPTVVDTRGNRTVEALVIEDDRITYIGPIRPEDAGLPSVDAGGLYISPGLIDAHVHLSLAPGSAFVDRSPDEVRARPTLHLRAYVASGVVAVLDTGITLGDAKDVLDLAESGPAPTVRLLGPLVSPPGGYVHVVLPTFDPTPDAATLQRQLDAFAPLAPIGIKVTMEDGMLRPIWPWQTPEVLSALEAQDQPVFVHAMESEEYDKALNELDVHTFVHPPEAVNEALLERLQGRSVISTLSVFDTLLFAAEPERLDDPLLLRFVPTDELEAARTRDTVRQSLGGVADAIMPNLPGIFRGIVISGMSAKGPLRARVKKMSQSVLALEQGGVNVVLGSDSGNWPVFLWEFHGATTVRELELLHQAGLTPAQALAAGTIRGAELLGIQDDFGTIAVGKKASFVILPTNPMEDPSAYRNPRWIVHNGEKRGPSQWMTE